MTWEYFLGAQIIVAPWALLPSHPVHNGKDLVQTILRTQVKKILNRLRLTTSQLVRPRSLVVPLLNNSTCVCETSNFQLAQNLYPSDAIGWFTDGSSDRNFEVRKKFLLPAEKLKADTLYVLH